MNKSIKLGVAGALLVCLLAGCSQKAPVDTAADGDFAPVTTLAPGTIASEGGRVASESGLTGANLPIDVTLAPETAVPENVPDDVTPEPASSSEPTAEPFTYSLIPISDRSMGFIFAYPDGWANLPGKNTICYREIVPAGEFPARVAVAKKSVAHTPKSSKVFSEFKSFADTIAALYDSETFEYTDQSDQVYFMGQKAYETYYLGYSDDIEVKGYMIACGIDYGSSHYIVIFHFCAPYEYFDKMLPMMKQMRDTVMFVD